MKKKTFLILLFLLVLIYPVITLFLLQDGFNRILDLEELQHRIRDYQISLWISWIIWASISVYYKWIQKLNFFFYLTYGVLLPGFVIFGIFYQKMVLQFQLPSRFSDTYTLGVLASLQNIITIAVLTGILQASVWWFTRRWHRK